MRVLIEVEGPAYRCTAAAALCAVLLGRDLAGDLQANGETVIPATSYLIEWLGDRIDAEGCSASTEELRHMHWAAHRLMGFVEQEIARQAELDKALLTQS